MHPAQNPGNDYTVFDQFADQVQLWISSIPVPAVVAVIVLLLALLLFGIVRKLLVFSIGIALLAVGIGALWVTSGHSIG